LFTAITRDGAVFLWPVNLTRPDSRPNAWNESALLAAQSAMDRWIRVRANHEVGAYEIDTPVGLLPDPQWPSLSFQNLLELAFRNHIIDAADHPVLRRLRGEM
jgi:hypothetical protein